MVLLMMMVVAMAMFGWHVKGSAHVNYVPSPSPSSNREQSVGVVETLQLLKKTFVMGKEDEDLFDHMVQPIFESLVGTEQNKQHLQQDSIKSQEPLHVPKKIGTDQEQKVFRGNHFTNPASLRRQRRNLHADDENMLPTTADIVSQVEEPAIKCLLSDFYNNIACNITETALDTDRLHVGIYIDAFEIEDRIPTILFHLQQISSNPAIDRLYIQVDINNWEYILEWVLVNSNLEWKYVTSLSVVGNLKGSLVGSTFRTFTNLTTINVKIQGVVLSNLTFSGPSQGLIKTIDLSGNNMLALPKGLLTGLTSLRSLYLNSNQLPTIDEDFFTDTHNLHILWMYNNHIKTLPNQIFNGLSQLFTLSLHNNQLETISRDLFANLPNIHLLDLSSNHISFIDENALTGLHNLTVLALARNNIFNLPENTDFFKDVPNLMELLLGNNFIVSIPDYFLGDLSRLTSLELHANELRSLPETLFHTTTSLKKLWLQDNSFYTLPQQLFSSLSQLQDLRLDNNNIKSFTPAHIASLHNLKSLALDENDLSTLHETTFQSVPLLEVVDLSRNPRLEISTTLVFPLENLHEVYFEDIASIILSPVALNLTYLTHLGVDGTLVLGDLTQAFTFLPKLQYFTLGFPGLDETSLPFDTICRALTTTDNVDLLSISGTNYLTINMCRDSTISSLYLRNNKRLTSILAYKYDRVDVSGCSNLNSLNMISSDILDISGTNLPFSSRYCEQLGRDVMFARGLRHVSFQNQLSVLHLLNSCFRFSQVFDFSDNQWLSDVSLIQQVASSDVVLADFTPEEEREMHFVKSGQRITSRPQLPYVVLDGTAISCSVQVSVLDVISTKGFALPYASFRFECGCSVGYTRDNNICVSTAISNGVIAGIAIGSTLFVLSIVLVIVYFRFRSKTREQNKLIREKEFQEREVEALKKVWQINLNELDLSNKVDEGAFGEVWKAQWDGVTVAVKFMKGSSLLGHGSELRVQEFDKELDFLRRTRHPHLVRFFGTGADTHGAPFIVLEFVHLGSLKHILFVKGLDNTLQRQRALASNTSIATDNRCYLTPSELKVLLVNDIAKGMEFLHSLNSMHRDLKSGNVLVNNKLIAKISDFGSMSQRITKLANAPSYSSYSNNGTFDETVFDDLSSLLYSPDSTTRTLAATMTAGVGTPLYMAPEVLDLTHSRKQKLTPKCDVFSFGVLMWEVWMCKIPDLIEQELGGNFRGPLSSALFGLYRDGHRLKFNDHHDDSSPPPHWYAELSLECMSLLAEDRPSFTTILHNDGFLSTSA
eukprot:m.104782 g.104782  ORF g.104782 m.104782 type:complete len:1280 (-) comp9119_c0_seq2:1568-5407(-)